MLQERNLPDKGVDFKHLMPHFVVGGDETCLMACATGVIKVFGDIYKKKNTKKTLTTRGILLQCCASATLLEQLTLPFF